MSYEYVSNRPVCHLLSVTCFHLFSNGDKSVRDKGIVTSFHRFFRWKVLTGIQGLPPRAKNRNL
jgi:hypothetical protein